MQLGCLQYMAIVSGRHSKWYLNDIRLYTRSSLYSMVSMLCNIKIFEQLEIYQSVQIYTIYFIILCHQHTTTEYILSYGRILVALFGLRL